MLRWAARVRQGGHLARLAGALALAWACGIVHALTPAELMKTLAGVSASQVRFVETRYSGMLKEPLVLEGRLVWQRPDRLERHVRSPYPQSIVLEGSRMTISGTPGSAARTVALPEGVPQALAEALRATLAGDLPALERHFAVSVGGTPANWTLTLAPREAALGALVGRVDFAGQGSAIERIEVLEANGDRSLTRLEAAPR